MILLREAIQVVEQCRSLLPLDQRKLVGGHFSSSDAAKAIRLFCHLSTSFANELARRRASVAAAALAATAARTAVASTAETAAAALVVADSAAVPDLVTPTAAAAAAAVQAAAVLAAAATAAAGAMVAPTAASFKHCTLRRVLPWSPFTITYVDIDSIALCQILRAHQQPPYNHGDPQHASHSVYSYWNHAVILKRICPHKTGQQIFDNHIQTDGFRMNVQTKKFTQLAGVDDINAPTPSEVTKVQGYSQEENLERARVAIRTTPLEKLQVAASDPGRTSAATLAIMDLNRSNTSATTDRSGSNDGGSSSPPTGSTKISSIGIVSHSLDFSAVQFRHKAKVIQATRQMDVWNQETAALILSISNLKTGRARSACPTL